MLLPVSDSASVRNIAANSRVRWETWTGGPNNFVSDCVNERRYDVILFSRTFQEEEPFDTGSGRVFSLDASFGLLATASASALALFLGSALCCCGVSCMTWEIRKKKSFRSELSSCSVSLWDTDHTKAVFFSLDASFGLLLAKRWPSAGAFGAGAILPLCAQLLWCELYDIKIYKIFIHMNPTHGPASKTRKRARG